MSDSERRGRRAAARRRLQRRRRLILLGALAAAAFAAGALLGAGEDEQPTTGEGTDAAAPVATLDDERLAGARLVAGWEGSSPPKGLLKLIASGGLAGVILFADNAPSERTARRQIERLQRIERPPGVEAPLLVMADQEGGQVSRLPGPPGRSAAEIAGGGAETARERGRATAASLREAGINLNLAPVLDVARPGSAIGRERRAFGSAPAEVAEIGGAFAGGQREGGLASTAKHFPGIGAAETNTDRAPQRIELSAGELRGTDMAPFGDFVADGGEVVMLSLASYPAIDDRPAALSRPIVEGELRERLGFEGVAMTDALDAEAARAYGRSGEVALAAVRAGADLLLYPDWREARAAGRLLARRLGSGALDRAAFQRSAARTLALRAGIGAAGGG